MDRSSAAPGGRRGGERRSQGGRRTSLCLVDSTAAVTLRNGQRFNRLNDSRQDDSVLRQSFRRLRTRLTGCGSGLASAGPGAWPCRRRARYGAGARSPRR
jgi:hypothetical protein